MCEFFSFVSNGRGVYKYLNWEQRQRFVSGDLNIESPDSHSSILDHYNIRGKQQDKWNKFEYNPLTRKFTVDMINNHNDSNSAKMWVEALDFKTIVEPLLIKPIINPFFDKKRLRCNKNDREKLKKWIHVRDSVRGSVWDSVRDSVRGSVWGSVWDSVRGSVWGSVWDSVRDSVRGSVWDSVRDSVWGSVWDSVRGSVWAYISSFFKLEKLKGIEHDTGINPYQPCIDLWESGLAPSFDGKTWRLHGHKGKIVFEMA